MDSFVILMLEKYGNGAIVFGVIIYLVVEGVLDIGTDLISHAIIKRKERKQNSEYYEN